VAEVDPLSALWAARTVAVVGASERAGTPGRQLVEHLLRFGYAGTVLAVNRRGGEVLGLTAYPSVAAAASGRVEVDLAVVVVPAAAVPDAVRDCAEAGVRVAVVGSSGFAETGPQGRALQHEVAGIARGAGMRLVGPNCIGSVGPATGLVASFSPLFAGPRTTLVPGRVGFASQSGALGFGAVSLAFERGIGLFAAVTTGNEADATALEVLAAMAASPECDAVVGYVESLADGAALRALAAAGKPVALLVGGASQAGARAAASHTGALATPARVVDGALRQLGIVRAHDVEDLLDAAAAFALVPSARPGRRPVAGRGVGAAGTGGAGVGVVTTSGGSGILAADAVAQYGLRLAELAPQTVDALRRVVPPYGATANPVDVTATVMRDPTLVARCLDAVAADPAVDVIVLCFCVLVGDDADAVVAALPGLLARYGKPVLVARTGAEHLAPAVGRRLGELGVPVYPTPARAVAAAAALARAPRADPAPEATRAAAAALARAPRADPAPEATRAAAAALARAPRADPAPGATRAAAAALARAPRAEPAPEATRAAAVQGDRPAGVPPPARGATEAQLKAVLAGAGIRVPRGRVVTDPNEAAGAVVDAGGRAVLKLVAPGLVHKTEAGGVLLGVTPRSAPDAAARLLALPGATGVLVEEQLPDGVELLVGIAPSPLGAALTLGAGGVLTELLDDVAVRLLPVTRAEIRDALAQTRVSRLLAGFRGRPPADVDALVALVARVAELAAGWPGSLDLNPVLVSDRGAVVLDAAYLPEVS
jgi:acetate---CoA ligase (ADP-forming)